MNTHHLLRINRIQSAFDILGRINRSERIFIVGGSNSFCRGPRSQVATAHAQILEREARIMIDQLQKNLFWIENGHISTLIFFFFLTVKFHHVKWELTINLVIAAKTFIEATPPSRTGSVTFPSIVQATITFIRRQMVKILDSQDYFKMFIHVTFLFRSSPSIEFVHPRYGTRYDRPVPLPFSFLRPDCSLSLSLSFFPSFSLSFSLSLFLRPALRHP